MSTSTVRSVITLVLAFAAATSQGCSDPSPTKVLRLEIDAAGAYTLEGRALADAELKEALAAAMRSPTPVELEVHASPTSNYQRVSQAVTLAQSLKIARVRFVQHGAEPQGGSASAAK